MRRRDVSVSRLKIIQLCTVAGAGIYLVVVSRSELLGTLIVLVPNFYISFGVL